MGFCIIVTYICLKKKTLKKGTQRSCQVMWNKKKTQINKLLHYRATIMPNRLIALAKVVSRSTTY